jgi:hypothetical protein
VIDDVGEEAVLTNLEVGTTPTSDAAQNSWKVKLNPWLLMVWLS